MNSTFVIFSFSTLLTSIASLMMGIFVVYKNKKSKKNILWSMVSIETAIWSFSLFMIINSGTEASAVFWNKILYLGAIFIPVSYFHFISVLLESEKKDKRIVYSLYFVSLLFLFFNFTSVNFITGAPPFAVFRHWLSVGYIYYFFVGFFVAVVLVSFIKLIIGIHFLSGIKQMQAKYILLCGVIGFTGGASNFLPQIVGVYPVGHYFVVFYIAVVTYSIVKHRLMDIRMVMRSSSVAIASFVSIVVPAIFIKGAINNVFAKNEWLDYILLIGAILCYPSLKNYYSRIANKYFFSSLYDSRQVIADLSDKLSTTLRVRRINKYIFETISSSMHSSSLLLLLYNEKTQKYKIQHSQGVQSITAVNLVGEKRLHLSFVKQNKPIIVEELRNSSYIEFRRTIDFLIGHGVEIIVPLNLKKKTIGIIALGPKESKDIYNKEDLQVLEIIGAQSAIAIQNALQYEEVKKFGIKLEKEVAEATAELRAANEELKKLDEAKSEFVSIASHQLRTPLTVIKGYISMILEGDFGKIGDKQVEPIKKVYASNERLIDLVEDLLNISRIESGRLRFNYKVMDIEPLISSVFEELQTSAKEKGLEFVYKKPALKLPDVNMDEEKIRQVIMNLTDNSIKYTKHGKVEVELKQVGNFIEYSVKDNGMGIKKEDMPNLFKKFSRGTGTSLIHTEGTGLGLYVARQMAEAHKGRVWAESDGPDKGAIFKFQIPIFDGRF